MAGDSAEVIDEVQIGGLAEAAGIEGVRMILEAFWTSTEELAAELLRALADHDNSGVARIGHTLKGSSANIGAAQMAATARNIEDAGKGGDIDQARAALEAFGQSIAETRAAIEDILSRYN